ncbi:MAG: hypothetical protein OJF48_003169 [Afipia sp.]|nr:MAG: hypothetical protein OJF48_003169 [Afipia sp.]
MFSWAFPEMADGAAAWRRLALSVGSSYIIGQKRNNGHSISAPPV